MIWLIIALCLVVSFVFSGIEAGILSVNRVRLAHRAKQRERAALKLQRLLSHPERLLITVLVVTNLSNILALVLVCDQLHDVLGRRGYYVALALYLPVYLLGLELLPKSLFRRFPYRALAALAEPLRLADVLLAPMHFIGEVVQKLFFGRRPIEQQRLFLGREDFRYYAAEGERTGTITKTEREMITDVVDFRAVTARDVMVALDPARSITADAPVSELLEKSARLHQDRWLVCGDDGSVTGVVSAFEVLIEGRRDVNVGVYQRRIVTVAAQEPAYSVLRKLRAARTNVAIVRGTGNTPLGRVTWEDLIRKLVSAAAK